MPRRTQPRHGSLQYWPRKRAKRIYPTTSFWPHSKDVKPLGFAAFKAGMSHVILTDNNPKSQTYGKSIAKPVTIFDAPSLFVCGFRLYRFSAGGKKSISEKWTTKLPKGLELMRKTVPARKEHSQANASDVSLIVCTQPSKSGLKKKKPDVFEIGIGGTDVNGKITYAESMLGKEIHANDVFKSGELVDVSAVTKGRGYTGPVKRYGIRIQTRKDKQMNRHVGSIGSTVPRKVDWRVPAAGQFGFFTRTEFNKKIIMVDNDAKKVTPQGGFLGYGLVPESFILVEGSVPGSRKRLVRLRKATRTAKTFPVDVKYISLASKQGA